MIIIFAITSFKTPGFDIRVVKVEPDGFCSPPVRAHPAEGCLVFGGAFINAKGNVVCVEPLLKQSVKHNWRHSDLLEMSCQQRDLQICSTEYSGMVDKSIQIRPKMVGIWLTPLRIATN